jgi:hypothetical protein
MHLLKPDMPLPRRARAEAAVNARRNGGCLQLDTEDLRGNPLTEIARGHRPLDQPSQLGVHRITLTHGRTVRLQR